MSKVIKAFVTGFIEGGGPIFSMHRMSPGFSLVREFKLKFLGEGQ
jgi:hypothetical protein